MTLSSINIVAAQSVGWQRVDIAKKASLRGSAVYQHSLWGTGSDISTDKGKNWRIFDDISAAKNDQGFSTLASDKGLFLAAGVDGKVALYFTKPRTGH